MFSCPAGRTRVASNFKHINYKYFFYKERGMQQPHTLGNLKKYTELLNIYTCTYIFSIFKANRNKFLPNAYQRIHESNARISSSMRTSTSTMVPNLGRAPQVHPHTSGWLASAQIRREMCT
jgi:hypothetical protein